MTGPTQHPASNSEGRKRIEAAKERYEALQDWRSKLDHTADECLLDVCPTCGCCCHGKQRATGCPMDDAPYGSQCGSAFSVGCACEGRS